MRALAFVLAGALLVLACTPAAAQVYRWTDEEGVVHYGDRPPAQGGGEAVDLRPSELGPDHPEVRARRERRERLLRAFAKERRERQEKAEAERREREQRERNCRTARENLRKVRQARYVYREAEDSAERTVLSDAERAEVRAKWEAQTERWCR